MMAILAGILLITDVNRLNTPEEISKQYLFSILDWELRRLPAKWSYKIKSIIAKDHQTKSTQLENIYSYFDPKRDDLDKSSLLDVEASFERVISDAIKLEGITYFNKIIFPPVSISLDSAPYVLITSPRNKIVRGDEALLKSNLSVQQAIDIENRLLKQENLSALVIPIGGIATYPVIVANSNDLLWSLETSAHEWLHTFLFFRPLGFNMFKSVEMHILNETVASLAGKEIGLTAFNLLSSNNDKQIDLCKVINLQKHEPNSLFNFRNEMKETRINTEKLLSEGKIDEAETYMKHRTLEFNANGYQIRKLNQAYFAFYGTYADSPGSISIIGPEVEEYRSYFNSLKDFIIDISKISSYQGFKDSLEKIKSQHLPPKGTNKNSTVIPFICQ
tara:strand:- start:22950 stop:24119 length:1170 start_codon:yes stop_codon:yes gene_type:complete